MKPVLTLSQMRECDRIAIEEIGIPGIVLMETASRAVAAKARDMIGGVAKGKVVVCLCGKGNNGGDGLAVARHLRGWGADVRTFLACDPADLSGDAALNRDILLRTGGSIERCDVFDEVRRALSSCDLIVDGLLGTGFSGEATGIYADLIETANSTTAPILAVDIPSAVMGDTGAAGGAAIRASATVTFGALKPGLLLQPGNIYAGAVTVADIGIPPEVIARQGVAIRQVDSGDIAGALPLRSPDSQKWDVGFVYLISGSPGLTGATALTALSAMRSGAGHVVAGVPKSLNPILEVKLTEAMTEPLAESTDGFLSIDAWMAVESRLKWADAVAIGPGLGRDPVTTELVAKLFETINLPLVIDADGLWHLAQNRELLKRMPRQTILTPHLIEMSRLTGLKPDEIAADRIGITRRFAGEWGVTLHLKGAPSVTASSDGSVVVNSSGNSGMASGGSGDVLTGIIAALLAGGTGPVEATWAGAYIHGLAGDISRDKLGERSMTAGDIINSIPEALSKLT